MMRITFDALKRERNLKDRGLDFRRADAVFDSISVTVNDPRRDYGEPRHITFGRLDDQIVVIVWTPRGGARRIISMRKANGREIKKIGKSLG